MKERRMTEELLIRAIELRGKSWSVKAISDKIGVSRGCVAWHFLKHGVEAPKPSHPSQSSPTQPVVIRRGRHVVRLFTVDEDLRLLSLAQEGLGDSEIGRKIGRRPNSVRGRMMVLARRDARAEMAHS